MTVINSNISALKAQANIAQNERKLNSAMERLSTGTRINAAKDDAAGLAISTKMTSQINGLNQAVRNANDAISMIATIEGALTQTTSVLQRMRELAVQSANDTNGVEDRQFLQAELVQMSGELDRIANQSRYNGLKVLDGNFVNKQFQIGANGNETINLNVSSALSSDIGVYKVLSAASGAMPAAAGASTAAAADTIAAATLTISGYIGQATVSQGVKASAYTTASLINGKTSSTGVSATAVTNAKLSGFDTGTVSFSVLGKNTTAVSVSASVSATDFTTLANAFNAVSSQTGVTAQLASDKASIMLQSADGYDINLADFTTNATTLTASVQGYKSDGTTTNGSAVTLTSAALTDSTAVKGTIDFLSNRAFTVSGGAAAYVLAATSSSTLSNVASADISTSTGSATALGIIDGALSRVSSMRGDLGAIGNRLEKTVDALTASSTNTAAARSRILDADYSTETTNLSKAQIIAQASNAMLAQANQQPQLVLSLLK